MFGREKKEFERIFGFAPSPNYAGDERVVNTKLAALNQAYHKAQEKREEFSDQYARIGVGRDQLQGVLDEENAALQALIRAGELAKKFGFANEVGAVPAIRWLVASA